MKNRFMSRRSILLLLILVLSFSVLLSACSSKGSQAEEPTVDEARANLAIIENPHSEEDTYAIPDGVTVLSSELHGLYFDDRAEAIPAKDSITYNGKSFSLTDEVKKSYERIEKGVFTRYRGMADDDQTIETVYCSSVDFPMSFVLSCTCSNEPESLTFITAKDGESYEAAENRVRAELQKVLDDNNTGIDLDDFTRDGHFFKRIKGDVELQWIQTFSCKHCKTVVGYGLSGSGNIEDFYDSVPEFSDAEYKALTAPLVEKCVDEVCNLNEVEVKLDRAKPGRVFYSEEIDRYYIDLDVRYELLNHEGKTINHGEIPICLILEPVKSNTEIMATISIAVLVFFAATAALVVVVRKRRKRQSN